MPWHLLEEIRYCMFVANVRKNKYFTLPFNIFVNRVTTVKYLGLITDQKLSWKSHIMHVIERCNKSIGIVKFTRICLPITCLTYILICLFILLKWPRVFSSTNKK